VLRLVKGQDAQIPPEPELLLSVSGSRCLRGRLLDPDIAKSSSGNLFGLKVAEAPGKPLSEDRGMLNIPPLLLPPSLGHSLGTVLKNWSLSRSICSRMFSKGSSMVSASVWRGCDLN